MKIKKAHHYELAEAFNLLGNKLHRYSWNSDILDIEPLHYAHHEAYKKLLCGLPSPYKSYTNEKACEYNTLYSEVRAQLIEAIQVNQIYCAKVDNKGHYKPSISEDWVSPDNVILIKLGIGLIEDKKYQLLIQKESLDAYTKKIPPPTSHNPNPRDMRNILGELYKYQCSTDYNLTKPELVELVKDKLNARGSGHVSDRKIKESIKRYDVENNKILRGKGRRGSGKNNIK